jgi:deferrochelatase/peroxidase EfeB
MTGGAGGFSRRKLLQGAGAAGVGIGLGGGGYLVGRAGAAADHGAAGTVPFHGEHQAGIATPAQDRLHFAAFDLDLTTKEELADLLREWTEAAAKMTQGQLVGETGVELAPPEDTGETVGLKPAQLTVTIGLGPGVFERDGADRLGLRSRRPTTLSPISPLPADELQPAISGGDLCVQACSNDPQVAFHAVRNLTRIARGGAAMRWSQLGFGRTSSTTTGQATPRNLMGFKDGTRNLRSDRGDDMERFVWLGADAGPAWSGGTIMVARRIRMLIEVWDRSALQDQEQTIGRVKTSGAPLGGREEFDTPDLDAGTPATPTIPADAHIRLAAPAGNADEAILRRGYSFTDGVVEEQGELDAGLFFICFQKDPKQQFEAIQRRLGRNDALNEYISHVGSAVFAVPPGCSEGGFVGERLFA